MGEQRNPGDSTSFLVSQSRYGFSVIILVCLPLVKLALVRKLVIQHYLCVRINLIRKHKHRHNNTTIKRKLKKWRKSGKVKLRKSELLHLILTKPLTMLRILNLHRWHSKQLHNIQKAQKSLS